MSELASIYESYVIPTYGRFDLDIARGQGSRVWDEAGQEYLDFGAGIAVCSLGHAHPAVTQAITTQAGTLVHSSNLYRTRPQALLAQRLVELTGPGKIFFCNSGAEANEGLIKLARKAGSPRGRYEIITFLNSFHGRTLAGISATGQDKVKQGFAPLLEGFVHVPLNDLEAVRQAITPRTAAILLEPIQGEGGINTATGDFLRALREICDQEGILLLFDEIQCGLGRTGTWCGWQVAAPEITPDGVSWAKGIANGFPLGGFWARDIATPDGARLCDVLGPGSHGTTYGGNPVACAAGLAVLETIEKEGLLAHAIAMGKRLVAGLKAGGLDAVRGTGLMIGLVLPEGLVARDFVILLQAQGLLVIPAGDRVIRFLPPLNVSPEEIDEAVTKVLAAFRKEG